MSLSVDQYLYQYAGWLTILPITNRSFPFHSKLEQYNYINIICIRRSLRQIVQTLCTCTYDFEISCGSIAIPTCDFGEALNMEIVLIVYVRSI